MKKRNLRFERNFNLKYLCILQCHEYDGSLESPWDSFDVLPDLAASCYGLEKLSIRLKNFLDSKDQLISECLFDVLNFPPKKNEKIWEISAPQESKKWSYHIDEDTL